jgi:hypothetical protein
MPTKSYPSDVIDQGHAVLGAWRSIDPALKVGELAPEALESDLGLISPNTALINRLEAELSEARNQREAISQAIWDKVKRVRRGVQAIYGDDSSQYDTVGGTRVSDRKPRVRKSVAA